MAVKPLNPNEIQDKKNNDIPDEIIESVNELLIKNWAGSRADIKQKDIVELALTKLKSIDRSITAAVIYTNHWMDIEDIFRSEGWIVSYDKPGWDEHYDAYFTFTKKRN